MSKEDKDKSGTKKIFNFIFLFLIFITLIYIGFVSYTGLKILNEKHCDVKSFDGRIKNPSIDSSFSLENPDTIISQEQTVDVFDSIRFNFCYTVRANTTSPLQLSILNTNYTTIRTDYITNGTTKQCSEISPGLLSRHNYIRFKCLNCDSDNIINLQREFNGVNKRIVEETNTSISLSNTNRLAAVLHSERSCRTDLMFFSKTYFLVMLLLSFVLLAIIGYENFHSLLLNMIEDEK